MRVRTNRVRGRLCRGIESKFVFWLLSKDGWLRGSFIRKSYFIFLVGGVCLAFFVDYFGLSFEVLYDRGEVGWCVCFKVIWGI